MGKKSKIFFVIPYYSGGKKQDFSGICNFGIYPTRENIPVDDKDSQEEAPNAEETNPSSRKTGGGSLVRWR